MPARARRRDFILASVLACSSLGCSLHREARVTQPVAMSPMADATLRAQLARILVGTDVVLAGFTERTPLIVVLRVTNAGPEPYTLNTASIACWLELSPDQPGETRALAAVAGGEGAEPDGGSTTLGSVAILPGETRGVWVRFQGHRYPGSDTPRKVTVWFPDARGRRVELVIADPGRGQRWLVEPFAFSAGFGAQSTTLDSSELAARAVAAQITYLWRVGPLLIDAGMSLRLILQRGGRLISETSGFDGFGPFAHLTVPLVRWSFLPAPWLLGLYGGGEAQYFNEITHPDSNGSARSTYSALSVEGGVEMDFSGQPPAQSPFPISYARPALPRWTARAGYTYWWTSGSDITANSGGFVMLLRFNWM
ncbi:MAG TPA: hypothetical protein VIF57_11430 [Polyangia bacterium]|jgi:hypothetical protein